MAVWLAASILSWLHVRRGSPGQTTIKLAATLALAMDVGLIVWRTMQHPQRCVPLGANFDAIIFFAAVVALVFGCFHLIGRLPSYEPFALPFLTLLHVVAIMVADIRYMQFADDAWTAIHLGTVILGAAPLTAASVAAIMYLIQDRRLRLKQHLDRLGQFASLERLDRLIQIGVTTGVPLLTVSVVSGVVRSFSGQTDLGPHWYVSIKFLLAITVWLVYVVLLYMRYAPRYRGRPAAVLAVVGLVGLLVLYVFTMIVSTTGYA